MAVNWNWQKKMGEVTLKQTHLIDGKELDKTYKVNLYAANCLFAMIYDFKEVDASTGKKKAMYSFYGFFNDHKHLAKSIGLEPNEEYNFKTGTTEKVVRNLYNEPDHRWIKVKLNSWFKDNLKTAELLSKAGFKVELYYKELKTKKATAK